MNGRFFFQILVYHLNRFFIRRTFITVLNYVYSFLCLAYDAEMVQFAAVTALFVHCGAPAIVRPAFPHRKRVLFSLDVFALFDFFLELILLTVTSLEDISAACNDAISIDLSSYKISSRFMLCCRAFLRKRSDLHLWIICILISLSLLSNSQFSAKDWSRVL